MIWAAKWLQTTHNLFIIPFSPSFLLNLSLYFSNIVVHKGVVICLLYLLLSEDQVSILVSLLYFFLCLYFSIDLMEAFHKLWNSDDCVSNSKTLLQLLGLICCYYYVGLTFLNLLNKRIYNFFLLLFQLFIKFFEFFSRIFKFRLHLSDFLSRIQFQCFILCLERCIFLS